MINAIVSKAERPYKSGRKGRNTAYRYEIVQTRSVQQKVIFSRYLKTWEKMKSAFFSFYFTRSIDKVSLKVVRFTSSTWRQHQATCQSRVPTSVTWPRSASRDRYSILAILQCGREREATFFSPFLFMADAPSKAAFMCWGGTAPRLSVSLFPSKHDRRAPPSLVNRNRD